MPTIENYSQMTQRKEMKSYVRIVVFVARHRFSGEYGIYAGIFPMEHYFQTYYSYWNVQQTFSFEKFK